MIQFATKSAALDGRRWLVAAPFLLAGLVGCSGQVGDGDFSDSEMASVGFALRTGDGVVLTSVRFDLDTQAGDQVKQGDIVVPNDNSTITGYIGALDEGDYTLVLSAEGTRDGATVTCETEDVDFSIDSGESKALAPLDLVCTVGVAGEDETGDLTFEASVSLQLEAVQDLVETFSVTPTSVIAENNIAPPMVLSIEAGQEGVTYDWSAEPDGELSFTDQTNTTGEYTCESNGPKTLTVTATLDETSVSKSVTVICDGFLDTVLCGDGLVEEGEQCDDGNDDDSDDCNNSCEWNSFCGNGRVDSGEECDDGNTDNTDSCSNTCTSNASGAVCGNGTTETGEACDDGNTAGGDYCFADCSHEVLCADGVTEPPEECNPNTDGEACGSDCLWIPQVCGDSIVSPGEECDDGNQVDTDGCHNDCTSGQQSCNQCLANAEGFIADYYASDCGAGCQEVLSCLEQTQCLNKTDPNNYCFCGDDVSYDTCAVPSYTPTGACADLLRASFSTSLYPQNADVMDNAYEPTVQAGVAFILATGTGGICDDACGFVVVP